MTTTSQQLGSMISECERLHAQLSQQWPHVENYAPKAVIDTVDAFQKNIAVPFKNLTLQMIGEHEVSTTWASSVNPFSAWGALDTVTNARTQEEIRAAYHRAVDKPWSKLLTHRSTALSLKSVGVQEMSAPSLRKDYLLAVSSYIGGLRAYQFLEEIQPWYGAVFDVVEQIADFLKQLVEWSVEAAKTIVKTGAAIIKAGAGAFDFLAWAFKWGPVIALAGGTGYLLYRNQDRIRSGVRRAKRLKR